MGKRFLTIWFPYLLTDWLCIAQPELREAALVCTQTIRGRMLITSVNAAGMRLGIRQHMVLADARAIVQNLAVLEEQQPDQRPGILLHLAEWLIRYSPTVAIDAPDGLILDITGCAHLWGGEHDYLDHLSSRLKALGYHSQFAIADTIGSSWAVAHFGGQAEIVAPTKNYDALLPLPPAALRVDQLITDKLHKLGLHTVAHFIRMPKSVLRRRFGDVLINRIEQAIGRAPEAFVPITVQPDYEARLPCLEPIRTAGAIEIAIGKLLEMLCNSLRQAQMGIRTAELKGFRIDGKIIRIAIGTHQSSSNETHLFKLFALKINHLAPGLGIELFTLTASRVEPVPQHQEKMWLSHSGLQDPAVAQLLDRVAGKVGRAAIRRFLPQAHYWPELAYKIAGSIAECSDIPWHNPLGRPIQLLHQPEPIQVTAPVPDYPPLLFIYQGQKHIIKKADGPERLERPWWIEKGAHRDYYIVEDEAGCRYWLFRAGHYAAEHSQWFIHGFFA